MEIQPASQSRIDRGRYLVLVDERADGGALLEELRQIAARDREARFTLLVPAKPARYSLTWTEGESIAAARRTASEAAVGLSGQGCA